MRLNRRDTLKELITRLDIADPQFAGSESVEAALSQAGLYLEHWVLPPLREMLAREELAAARERTRKRIQYQKATRRSSTGS